MHLQNLELFNADIYRLSNTDLRECPDLRAHFDQHGIHERRIFGPVATTHDRMSMRWLRGKGIEIGAGSAPTKLFGATMAVLADSDPTLRYGGEKCDQYWSLDDPALNTRIAFGEHDFAIASHVLEHLDSLIVGVKNLIGLVRVGGIVYAAVPCCNFDHDQYWMERFPFSHHLEELRDPLKNAQLHDEAVRAITGRPVWPVDRFLNHKHSYDFQGWCQILLETLEFLDSSARIVDAAFGYERMDANFVLERVR